MDYEGKQLSVYKTCAYRTYICGSDAIYFDKDILDIIKRDISLLRVLQGYRSIWRILHIDGFEKPEIPFQVGNFRHFFQYTSTANN